MPTSLLLMNGDKYPFGQSLPQSNGINRTLVKQTLNVSDVNFSSLLKTSQLSKKLSEHKVLIRLQRILQQDNSICLHYEYVPIQLSKYIEEMDENFIKNYRNGMFQLASLLAENRIICDLSVQRMGLSENYEPKYFLGVDFVQKKQVNIFQLKNDYVQEIKIIFHSYLNKKNTQLSLVSKKQTKNLVRVDTRMSDTQQISSSYVDNDNLIKTRKHESIYYQRTKDHQIKRRKQSYMSSVSNLRLNNLYKRINEIELQVCNTRGTGSNNKFLGNGNGGFKMSIEGRQFLAKSSFGGSSSKRSIMEIQEKKLQIYKGLNNYNNNSSNKNLGYMQRNSITTPNIANNNNLHSLMNKTLKSNFIKYPGYDQQDDEDENVALESPRYQGIQTHKNLEISAHQIITNNQVERKEHYKKFSTQFPTLSDFQQPIMAITNALRNSANGLDGRSQRKTNKKIQLFKQRQYSQIKSVSGNTNYIRDFMSVLEQQTSTNERTSKNNENQNQYSNSSQQNISKKPLQIQMYSQESIQDVGFTPFSQQLNKKKRNQILCQLQQNTKTHSYNKIPQQQSVKNYFHPNSCQQINVQSNKYRPKISIEETFATPDIHDRVKGVIQNSKKLIEKLRQKNKKNT